MERAQARQSVRLPLGHGVTAVIDTYLHHAVAETRYFAAPQGESAVRLAFTSSRFKMDQWLAPSMGAITMGLARVRLQQLPVAVKPENLQQTVGQFSRDEGRLGMLVDGRPVNMAVSELALAAAIPDSPYRAQVLRRLAHGEVRAGELVATNGKPDNPCVEVQFVGEQGSLKMALFAHDSSQNRVLGQVGKGLPIRALYVLQPASVPPATRRSLELFIDPTGKLFYNLDGKIGELQETSLWPPVGWTSASAPGRSCRRLAARSPSKLCG